jgi:hypothetical protein
VKRGLDFEKAEAALRRAADKGLRGTREERSGRFLSGDRTDRKAAILVERVRDTKVGGRDKWRKPRQSTRACGSSERSPD